MGSYFSSDFTDYTFVKQHDTFAHTHRKTQACHICDMRTFVRFCVAGNLNFTTKIVICHRGLHPPEMTSNASGARDAATHAATPHYFTGFHGDVHTMFVIFG